MEKSSKADEMLSVTSMKADFSGRLDKLFEDVKRELNERATQAEVQMSNTEDDVCALQAGSKRKRVPQRAGLGSVAPLTYQMNASVF